MKTVATRTVAAAALLAALAAVDGCSGASQNPAALGTASSATTAAHAPTPSSQAGTGWLAPPSSIALPAGLSFAWGYTPSGKADLDQAVEAVEDINRAEIAGIGSNPQNPNMIDFNLYASGQTLAWIRATFTDYARNNETWTGAARFYNIATSDFQGSGVGESGIVQFCSDGAALIDKNRRTGASVADPSGTALVTFKVTAVPGGWQASNFTAVVKDPSCDAG